MSYPCQELAQLALQFETMFDETASGFASSSQAQQGAFQIPLNGEMYTVLDVRTFPETGSCKAMTVKDSNGNIYVHFRGTGPKNWIYNSVAYGVDHTSELEYKTSSALQDWASDYFDLMVETYYEGNPEKRDLFVTGHSQGGNNAQFVTLNSKYGDYITNCITADGQGFSYESVEYLRTKYGESRYQQQIEKIYAYNGKSDYVSCLGQVSVVNESHTYLVEYSEGFNAHKNDSLPVYFHASNYLLNKDGEIGSITEYSYEANSDIRKLVLALNRKVCDLPQDQQQKAAVAMMHLIEQLNGSGEKVMTDEDYAVLWPALASVLTEVLAEYPELVVGAASEIPNFSSEFVTLIGDLVNLFNTLPEAERTEALYIILSCVSLNEQNKIDFEWEFMFQDGTILSILKPAIPLLVEAFLNHPENIMTILQEFHLDEKLKDYFVEHPAAAIAVTLLSIAFFRLGIKTVIFLEFVDIAIRFVDSIINLAKNVADFIYSVFETICSYAEALQTWFRNTFNRGVKYARANPYFMAAPENLRAYADRIWRVNRDLVNLDGELNGLYWQVGLLDVLDILNANLITSYSPTLHRVEAYLRNTAQRLENAENRAFILMGGY